MIVEEFIRLTREIYARNDASPRDYLEAVQAFFYGMPIPMYDAPYRFVCRARPNEVGQVFSNVAELSYNPHSHLVKLQRANFAGQSLFYAAAPAECDAGQCSTTAILETAFAHIREHSFSRAYITLSKWEINRQLRVFMLPFSEKACLRNRDMAEAAENFQAIMDELRSHSTYTTEEFDEYEKGLRYISELLCQTEEKDYCYNVTAAFFNYMMAYCEDGGIPLDGMIYPSANTEAAGMNIVLKTELADTGVLSPSYVVMYAIQRHPDDDKDITFSPASSEPPIWEDGSFCFTHIW